MKLHCCVLILGFAWALALSQAQNTPQDFLDLHNEVRVQLKVGNLTWDDEVAAFATNYANERSADCELVHSHGPYGENIYFGSGQGYDDAAAAVKYWVDEWQYYDYGSNSCTGGQQCLHYTQVVWSRTKKLGCATAQCSNGATFITCNYDPPGNMMGERPY